MRLTIKTRTRNLESRNFESRFLPELLSWGPDVYYHPACRGLYENMRIASIPIKLYDLYISLVRDRYYYYGGNPNEISLVERNL